MSFAQRLEILRRYNPPADISNILDRLAASLSEMGFAVQTRDPSLNAVKGSRTRTWWHGASGVDPTDLPIRLEATVDVAAAGRGFVTIRIMDDYWRFGLRTGAEAIFLRYFESVAEELARKAGLSPVSYDFSQVAGYAGLRARHAAYLHLAGLVFIAVVALFLIEAILRLLMRAAAP